MDLSAFAEARGKYRYVPARLVSSNGRDAVLTWGLLSLAADIPSQSIWDSAEGRSAYSSMTLDDHHKTLLNSDVDAELLHGLVSAVFWGYASGSDHKLHPELALVRASRFKNGRGGNISPQPTAEIVDRIKSARALLRKDDIGGALIEMMKIKFLGMPFASKILMFMKPEITVVYDSIISLRLNVAPSAELQAMHVKTTRGTSQTLQAQRYVQWCRYCSSRADALDKAGIPWVDWDKKEFRWRAVDVERAFFATGR